MINDPIWKNVTGTRPTSSKIVEIAYQLRDDCSGMMKNRKKKMILHFNPPGFYK